MKQFLRSKAFGSWISRSTFYGLWAWLAWMVIPAILTGPGVVGNGLMNILTAVSIPAGGLIGLLVGAVGTYRIGGKGPPSSGEAEFRQAMDIVRGKLTKWAHWLRFWQLSWTGLRRCLLVSIATGIAVEIGFLAYFWSIDTVMRFPSLFYIIPGVPIGIFTSWMMMKANPGSDRAGDVMGGIFMAFVFALIWPATAGISLALYYSWRQKEAESGSPPGNNSQQRFVQLKQSIRAIKSWRPGWFEIGPIQALRRS